LSVGIAKSTILEQSRCSFQNVQQCMARTTLVLV
jgi:hypothetical protein